MIIQSMSLQGILHTIPNQPVPLFEDLTCDIPLGHTVWITGKAGVGKSTFLQILASLVYPKSGQFLINGIDVYQLSFDEFTPTRLQIGYAFDMGGLIANQTVRQNLMLPLQYHDLLPLDEANHRVELFLRKLQVLDFADQRPAHVPGSVRRAAVVLRSLILYPELVLFDDPTLGLNDSMVASLVDLIGDLKGQGLLRTLIISSSDRRFKRMLDTMDCELTRSSFAPELGVSIPRAS